VETGKRASRYDVIGWVTDHVRNYIVVFVAVVVVVVVAVVAVAFELENLPNTRTPARHIRGRPGQ